MNFVTKKHLPRRTFLRGVGVTLALPFMDSMVPAQTPSSTGGVNRPTRFLGVWHPHGAAPGHWHPKGEGRVPARADQAPLLAHQRHDQRLMLSTMKGQQG